MQRSTENSEQKAPADWQSPSQSRACLCSIIGYIILCTIIVFWRLYPTVVVLIVYLVYNNNSYDSFVIHFIVNTLQRVRTLGGAEACSLSKAFTLEWEGGGAYPADGVYPGVKTHTPSTRWWPPEGYAHPSCIDTTPCTARPQAPPEGQARSQGLYRE